MALNVIELFGGIGAFTQAVKSLDLPINIVDYVEINPYSVKAYNAINGTDFPPQDITQFHAIGDKYSNIDVIMHGSPCFTADALVLTKDGYKKIIDVEVGDYVLTHENTYEKVVNFFDNGKKDIIRLVTSNMDEIKTTSNHRFWVRTMYQTYPTKEDGKRTVQRNWKSPEWKEVKDLTTTDWVGVAINQNNIIPDWHGIECKRWTNTYIKKELNMEDENLWYLVGRYLGDGWTRVRNNRGGNISGIIICCAKDKADAFATKISEKYHYTLVHDRTTDKFQFANRELGAFCAQFGHSASNKFIPGFVFDMPVDLIKSLLAGYFESDGCCTHDTFKATSTSRELMYGIAQLIAKAYHLPCSIYKTERPKTHVIEGRVVNQHDSYQLTYRREEDVTKRSMFYEDGYLWYPIRKIEPLNTQENVYDIEVENSHSFTANSTICHNCQDFSIAGKQKGGTEGSGTRSSLLYETIRIVTECKPKVVIWENVPNLVSSKFQHVFMDYVRKMIALGYRSYYKVLNAKDYGIPQNRERVFTVSILGEHKPYVFPEKEPLHLRLIDLLEKNVDESYYLSDKMIEKFTWTKNGYNNAVASQLNAAKRIKDQTSAETDVYKPRIRQIGSLNKGHQRDAVLDINGITGTLTSTDYKQPKSIAVPADGILSDDIPTFDANGRVEAEIKQVGQLYGTETEPNPQAGRVYDAEGLAPTMDTCSGGNRMPKIVEPVADCQQVGNVFGNDGKEHQSTAVYNVDGVAPTVCALANKGVIKVAEPAEVDSEDAVGCAIRNREDGEQLEFRKDNLVSALHGNIMKSMVATPEQPVAKRRVRRISISAENKSDTASAEINPQLVGGVGENDWNGQFHQGDRVYDANGVAVTLSSQGGGLAGGSTALYAIADTDTPVVGEAKCLRPVRTEQGKAMRKQYEAGEIDAKWSDMRELEPRPDDCTNTLTTVQKDNLIAGREATKSGRKMAGIGDSIDIAYVAQNRRRGRVLKDIAHTLVTSGNEQAVVVPDETVDPFIVASRGRNPENPSDRTVGVPTTQHLEANSQGLCNTLTTVQKDNYVCEPNNELENNNKYLFKIRKLTPMECWRLMGFSDECYHKAAAVSSKSRLYEMAGNSIVTNCLQCMMKQLLKSVEFEGLENNEQESESSQS